MDHDVSVNMLQTRVDGLRESMDALYEMFLGERARRMKLEELISGMQDQLQAQKVARHCHRHHEP